MIASPRVPAPLSHRERLIRIARRAMEERGLAPDFPEEALRELAGIKATGNDRGEGIRDLRALTWCSIDNDDSRDLDQITAALEQPDGSVRLLVAVADVDGLVKPGMGLDHHARTNTTSIYTAGAVFPMLPERLSTDLTSLNQGQERMAIVTELEWRPDGSVRDLGVSRARVMNRAKLAYSSVSDWIEGRAGPPAAVSAVPGLEDNLQLQDRIAQSMRTRRHEKGSLELETAKGRAVFDGDLVRDFVPETRDRAHELIEEFMIAANTANARSLDRLGMPVLRRIVRTPRHWGAIVALAADFGFDLPSEPDSRPLQRFLAERRLADPARFADLSLSVVKLLGPGEYAVDRASARPEGHFALAVSEYAHSTAPNRRFADLITQRLIKAALEGGKFTPYADGELAELARLCTEKQDAARKVERQVAKSAAALLLEHRIGKRFPALVTGSAEKGTWVRISHPPVEGRLIDPHKQWKVGDCVLAELKRVDVEEGHIDFKAIGPSNACVVRPSSGQNWAGSASSSS